jgi:RNA polymerase sigma-70 factor (ECF subfamily)
MKDREENANCDPGGIVRKEETVRALENLPMNVGQEETVEIMFQRYHPIVYNAAYRITGRPADAEDVLQTVFTKLVRHERDGRLDLGIAGNPRAYLYRSAVNASLDVIRRRKAEKTIDLDNGGAAVRDHLPATRTEPGRLDPGDRERLREALREALLMLSPLEAETFALRYFEGHSNQEIAGMLQKTPNAVNVTLHSAREKLQKSLKVFGG